jgi:hypothetical protein
MRALGKGTGAWGTAIHFDGEMSNYVVWDSDQTLEAENIYNNGTPANSYTNTPISWWKLDNSATFENTNWIIPNATITPTYTSAIVLTSTYQNPPASYTSVTRSTTTWSSDHITLSFWTKFPTGFGTGQNVMHADGFTVESFQSTKIQFGHGSWYKNFTLNNAYDGAWHHYVVYIPNNATIDVIDVRFWEDGQEIIGSTVGSTPAPQITTISGWGHGTFAELSNWALFDTDLSSAGNIATLYNNGTPGDISSLNPVTWYKCDEANVDFPDPVTGYINFTDSSGNSNTGACAYDSDATPPDPHRPYIATTNVQAENGVSSAMTETNLVRTPISFSNVYSKFSFDFDGVNDWINCGSDSIFDLDDEITLSAWMKTGATDTTATIGPILFKDSTGGGQRSYGLCFRPLSAGYDKGLVYIFHTNGNATSLYTSTAGALSDGNWHHVMATYDGTDGTDALKIYVDGVLDNTATPTSGDTGILVYAATNFTIGSISHGSSWFFGGSIDEAALFSTDQSANISTIYNSGQPADLTSLSPVAWYRMGEDAHYNAAVGVSGNTTADDAAGDLLIDTGVDFTTLNVEIGDLVRNTTTSSISRVNTIAATQLTLDDAIFPSGSSPDGYKITGPVVWTVPDQIGSNDGTSSNMSIQDLQGEAPNYSGAGASSNMYIEDRVGNAPNSDKNALSYNMLPDDIDTDVP